MFLEQLFDIKLFFACFFGGSFAMILWNPSVRYFDRKLVRKMRACETIPPRNDANRSAEQMIGMLQRRMCKLNIQQKNHPKGYIRNFGSFTMNRTLSSFILMAHAVGCEVVLRAREDRDIEENPKQIDALIAGEKV